MITHERLLEALEYQPHSGRFFWRIGGGPRSVGKIAGRINEEGYVEIGLDGKLYKAHRLAWFYVHSRWPALRMDHRSGDRSDNRIENLREANGQQNAANRRVAGASMIKGIYKRGSRFVAGIKVAGRRIHLGSFATRDGAASAYEVAAKHHFGEFASVWIAPEITADGVGGNDQNL